MNEQDRLERQAAWIDLDVEPLLESRQVAPGVEHHFMSVVESGAW